MRRFRVGDRVRFETDKTGDWPRWDYSLDCGGDGGFLSGTVTDEDDLCLTVEWDKMERWEWPQPGEPDSEYGAPGYLELVEAVEEQEVKSCATCHYLDVDIDTSICGGCNHHDRWAPKPESTKTMTVEGCVETRHSVPVRSCETCAWCNVCNAQGARCQSDDFLSWEAGEKLPPKPLPEVEKMTKTMTVDEVAEMVEGILLNLANRCVKTRARAIAEALVGVKVKR